jgi:hypothetical protein
MKTAEKKIMFAQQRKLMKSFSGLKRSGSEKVKPMWHRCAAKKPKASSILRSRKV